MWRQQPLSFEAIGTKWWVSIDRNVWPADLPQKIVDHTSVFDQQFSRFISDSELSRLNDDLRGKSTASELLSPGMFALLQSTEQLKNVTHGAFDPNISSLLRGYGYDATYTFHKDEQLLNQPRGEWWLEKPNILHTKGNVEFDSGGMGKGILIDEIAALLRDHNLEHFLVDGGGDMFATTKSNGSPWTVALQHPYHSDEAIGTTQLSNQGFAASASTHRKVGEFHHILDPHSGKPANQHVAVFCTGPSATAADTAATAFFVSDEKDWPKIQQLLSVEYLVLQPDMSFTQSALFRRVE